MAESITQAELISQAIETRLRDVHVALPCEVTKVDISTQKVDVRPVVTRSIPRGDEDPVEESFPTIQAVPLVFPRGGGFFISVPVSVGDFVLCVFSERDFGRWMNTGNQGNPGDQRYHSLAGAMAIPGVFPNQSKLGDASATNLVLGKDGGVNVTVTASRMEVDGSSDAAALASKVKALEAAYNIHVHPLGSPNVGVPTVTQALTYDSTKLKVGG